jgi:hypothetical protein
METKPEKTLQQTSSPTVIYSDQLKAMVEGRILVQHQIHIPSLAQSLNILPADIENIVYILVAEKRINVKQTGDKFELIADSGSTRTKIPRENGFGKEERLFISEEKTKNNLDETKEQDIKENSSQNDQEEPNYYADFFEERRQRNLSRHPYTNRRRIPGRRRMEIGRTGRIFGRGFRFDDGEEYQIEWADTQLRPVLLRLFRLFGRTTTNPPSFTIESIQPLFKTLEGYTNERFEMLVKLAVVEGFLTKHPGMKFSIVPDLEFERLFISGTSIFELLSHRQPRSHFLMIRMMFERRHEESIGSRKPAQRNKNDMEPKIWENLCEDISGPNQFLLRLLIILRDIHFGLDKAPYSDLIDKMFENPERDARALLINLLWQLIYADDGLYAELMSDQGDQKFSEILSILERKNEEEGKKLTQLLPGFAEKYPVEDWAEIAQAAIRAKKIFMEFAWGFLNRQEEQNQPEMGYPEDFL